MLNRLNNQTYIIFRYTLTLVKINRKTIPGVVHNCIEGAGFKMRERRVPQVRGGQNEKVEGGRILRVF